MRCHRQSGQSQAMRMGATVEKRQLFLFGTKLGGEFSRHIFGYGVSRNELYV